MKCLFNTCYLFSRILIPQGPFFLAVLGPLKTGFCSSFSSYSQLEYRFSAMYLIIAKSRSKPLKVLNITCVTRCSENTGRYLAFWVIKKNVWWRVNIEMAFERYNEEAELEKGVCSY
jgi:hypothetical protein